MPRFPFLNRVRSRVPAVGALFVATLIGTGAQAQSAPERLFESCVDASPTRRAGCADAALALQAMHAGVGLFVTSGGAVTAHPSTVGRRLAARPRILMDAGVMWTSFRHPDLAASASASGRRDVRTTLYGGQVTGAVGVFEGFSPVPNVGGVLALDLVGTAQLLRLPEARGFSGSTGTWGGGMRLGVFRESFTLPGVTLSAMHHRSGTIDYGDPGASGTHASFRPNATSLRVIVGRDLLAVGISGGAGWDRYGGTGRIQAADALITAPSGTAGPEGLRMTRRYLFAGANFTWVVAQVAAEAVWAWSGSPLAELEGSGPHRPGGRELQGALSGRITY